MTNSDDFRIVVLFRAVHDFWRQARRWQDVIARERGMTTAQVRTLAQLCKADGLSQAELAGMTESDPMTMSGILERLEAKSFIRRAPHPGDSRAKVVYVTDLARELVAEARAAVFSYEDEILDGVSDVDLSVAYAVLGRISANLARSNPVSESIEA